MRTLSTALALLTLTGFTSAQEEKKDAFALPSDLAGKRIEALLRPGSPLGEAKAGATPLPRPAPRFLEEPAASAGPIKALPPRLALPDRRVKAPPHPAEPTTLLHTAKSHALPAAIHLVTGEPVRWP